MKNRKKLHLSTPAENGSGASAHTEALNLDNHAKNIIGQISEIVQSSRKKLLQLLEVEDVPPEGNTITTYVFFDKERRKPTLYNPSMEDDPSYTHISFAPIIVDFNEGNPRQIIKNVAYKIDKVAWTKIGWALDLDMPNDDEEIRKEKLEKLCAHFRDMDIHPTVAVKTNKGYHLLWLLEDRYEIKDSSEWLKYSSLLDRVTAILKKDFPFIDKSLHKGYIRLPLQDNDLILYEELYERPFRYTKDYIVEKFTTSFSTKLENFEKFDEDKKTDFPPISFEDLKRALTDCHHLKNLMETFKDHSYNQWFMALRALVNLYLLAPKEEKEKIRERIHELSSQHPSYTYEETEYMIDYLEKTGFKPVTCRTLLEYVDGDVEDCKNHCKFYKITNYDVLAKLSPYLSGRYLKVEILRLRKKGKEHVFYSDGRQIYLFTLSDGKHKPFLPFIKIDTIFSYPTPDGKMPTIIYAEGYNIHGAKIKLALPEPVNAQDKDKFIKLLLSANVIEAPPDKEKKELIFDLFKVFIGRHRKKHSYKEGEINPKNVDLKSFLGEEMVYDPFKLNFATIPENILRLLVEHKVAPPVVYDRKGDAFVYFHRLSEIAEIDPWAKYIAGVLALPLHYRPFHELPILSGNPVVLLVGNPGTGKTVRGEALMSLWGRGIEDPTARAYQVTGTSFLSEAFLSYILPFFRTAVMFDDLEDKEEKNKKIDINSFIKTLFNATRAPIRLTASVNYQGKLLKAVCIITMEPEHYAALTKDKENKTGTARRILPITIPDRKRQAKITGRSFDTLMEKWDFFRATLTREHFGFINEYYKWLEENVNINFYDDLVKELKNYNLENTYRIHLALTFFHAYHFARFLNEQYQADIHLFLSNKVRIPLAQAKAKDFINEFQHITGNEFEVWEEEEEEFLNNLLANANIILTGKVKDEVIKRPLSANTVMGTLNNGSKKDKMLLHIIFGQNQRRGAKVTIIYNSHHAPLSLFFYDVRTNKQNNAYTRCIEALEHNIDMLLNHPYYRELKQYIAINIQAPKNKRDLEKEVRLFIYKLYIRLLHHYAPAHLEVFMKELHTQKTQLFLDLQDYYKELTGTEPPKGNANSGEGEADIPF